MEIIQVSVQGRSEGKISWKPIMEQLAAKGIHRTQAAVSKRWQKYRAEAVARDRDPPPPPPPLPQEMGAGPSEIEIEVEIIPGLALPMRDSPDEKGAASPLVVMESAPPMRDSPDEKEEADSFVAPTPPTSGQDRTTDVAQPVQPPGDEREDDRQREELFAKIYQEASNSFRRRKLPRVRLSGDEIEFIEGKVLLHHSGTEPLDAQWSKLNACLYAAVKAVADSQPRRSSGFTTWLNNKQQQLRTIRQWIGKAEAESLIRCEGLVRTRRQKSNAAALRRYRHQVARGVDLQGFITMMKQRLETTKEKVRVRTETEERQRVRLRANIHPSIKSLTTTKQTTKLNVKEATTYWKEMAKADANGRRPIHPILRAWREQLNLSPLPTPVWNTDRILATIKKIASWKSPGPDGIPAAYWKIPAVQTKLVSMINNNIETGAKLPNWLCEGRTVLIYKDGDQKDPANYRPITCLNTCYKIMSGSIANWLDERTLGTIARPKEQRALVKRDWSCTTASMMDVAMSLDSKIQRGRSLEVAWIDFSKAYDSLPHQVLDHAIESLQLPMGMQAVYHQMKRLWRTRIEIASKKGRTYRITKGVLQGDALSPLLFVIAISPLSFHLNGKEKCPAYTQAALRQGLVFNHQLYMDDLKLYGRTRDKLQGLFKATETATRAIGMRMNIRKTAASTTITPASTDEPIPIIGERGSYKYLGIHQRISTNTRQNQEELKKKIIERANGICASQLTFRQKITALNTTVLPMARYSFMNSMSQGKFLSEVKHSREMDGKLRNILTKHKLRFRKSCIARLYIHPEEGGYGLQSFETELLTTAITRALYITLHDGMQGCHVLFETMSRRSKRNPLSDARQALEVLGIDLVYEAAEGGRINGIPFRGVKDGSQLARRVIGSKRQELLSNEWHTTSFHEKIVRNPSLDWTLSHRWIEVGNLSAENARNGIAIQERAIITRTHPASTTTDTTCRRCQRGEETIPHILTSCERWRTNLAIERHDSVGRNIYYHLAKKYGLWTPHYTEQVPSVASNDSCSLWWNFPFQTTKKLHHNRPDLVLLDRSKKRVTIIEVAVADPSNMLRQLDIKRVRYQVNSEGPVDHTNYRAKNHGANLVEELGRKFRATTRFLPVIIGTAGEVLTGTLQNIKEELQIDERTGMRLLERLQRSAVLGSSRIIKNHLAKD